MSPSFVVVFCIKAMVSFFGVLVILGYSDSVIEDKSNIRPFFDNFPTNRAPIQFL